LERNNRKNLEGKERDEGKGSLKMIKKKGKRSLKRRGKKRRKKNLKGREDFIFAVLIFFSGFLFTPLGSYSFSTFIYEINVLYPNPIIDVNKNYPFSQ